ncbi:MAG: MotA/TolQ/ExbB proton channel family protein [Rickettsiales bacterium]|jgi:biopolymer transport protein ExbB/TolQ|nr:MotA/TolQ/ExbB proton channel family protein [Rickettsiales bacterium]
MEQDFSFLTIFSPSDPVVFLTSVLLVVASIASWTIIIGRLRLWGMEKTRPLKLGAGADIDAAMEPYDKNLWFLSVCAAVGPFVGLFGTIWGIMHLFASVGATGSTSLAVVAPGLAIALGETALGLFVAIPAAIFFQYFSKKSDDLYNKLESEAKRK